MHASRQIVRCYPAPDKKRKKGLGRWRPVEGCDWKYYGDGSDYGVVIANEISRVGFPWAGPMLLFDCETLTDACGGQRLRFGTYQERGYRYDWRVNDAMEGTLTREKLDRCWSRGIFYEPANCTDKEIAVLEAYAREHKRELMTRVEFVKHILFRNHWVKRAEEFEDSLREPCLVIGQNLPFDLGCLAIRHGLAREDLYGGLSMILCGGEHDPEGGFEQRVAIKKIGFGKHLYTSSKSQNGWLEPPWEDGEEIPRKMEMVEFLDTQTVSRALLGPGPTGMKALLERHNVPKEFRKGVADYHGPITPKYISYCEDDVENTWQIFKACRTLHLRHGRRVLMQKLYSEASLGKSYFKDFGIEGFTKLNPDFDPKVIGAFLETFYGGRSDVRIRHQIVRVRVADFTSQYPSNNALMGLQDLVTAEKIGVKRDDPGARRFLETVELGDLQAKETWRKLRGIALVKPGDMQADILPFRTMYGEKADGTLSTNIGVNKIVSACPAWYTFAHVVASKLLTGKTPKILKTLELFPIGRQKTNVIKLFGDDRYKVDLTEDDLFATLIDARIDFKNELENDATPPERRPFLNSIQNGLKVTANGTSYGALVEFIADEHLAPQPTTVYFGEDSAKVTARARHVGVDGDVEISDYKAEKAGRYFAPYGTLIPAAGHLMLAIAERLAADRGLTYAYCDTDCMGFADYWNRYSDEEFDEKVKEITDWFQPLNPYKHDVRLFNMEKVNYKLRNDGSGKTTKKLEPLYCVAVSAKRYCLFNIDKRGRVIIRKATAHGLGDVMLPTGYRPRFVHVAAPVVTIRKARKRDHSALIAGSAAPLFLDLWMKTIMELRAAGNLNDIDKIIDAWPKLHRPHHYQTSLGTRDAWLNYTSLPNRRPFQFMTCLSAPIQSFTPTRPHDFMQAEIEDACSSSLYTAFSKPFKLDLDQLYRRDNNEMIRPLLDAGAVRLTTARDRIKSYFHHMEAKSEGKVGLLERRCVVGITKVWIGKE
jgi:hypothetical protein